MLRLGGFLSCSACLLAQPTPVIRERTSLVPPTMWASTKDNPPCELQVYLGRINTTRDASSCARLCVSRDGLAPDARPSKIVLYSREEGQQWREGSLDWSAWEPPDLKAGCAVFKNWSNNRFREARIAVLFQEGKR